jgi:uncharacterized protein YdhG (YjbR/CyaY superfamily)
MKKAATVEEYLEQVPEPQRSTLEKMRTLIRAAAPKEATEGLSYGMPAFFHNGALVCYAAFKNHCSFFPMSGRLVGEFAADVEKYKTSKGTIQFAVDKPLPAALVKKFVKSRVADNEAKKKKKKA